MKTKVIKVFRMEITIKTKRKESYFDKNELKAISKPIIGLILLGLTITLLGGF